MTELNDDSRANKGKTGGGSSINASAGTPTDAGADASAPVIVGLGEVLWDCFPDGRRPGGAPANVAFHARQLGMNGVVCSRVGSDTLGDELLAYLRDHGLVTDHIQRDAERPTGTVTVHAERVDGPSYTIHENVAWDSLDYTGAMASLFGSAAAVCFGTLAQRSPAARKTIHRCLDVARNALRVYDVNLRPPHVAREWIEASMSRADVVKLNAAEAEALCAMFAIRPATPRKFAEVMIQRYGIATVVVTHGADGCRIYLEGEESRVAGRPVEVADTVGAGDAFSAGLIYGLLSGWEVDKAAGFANALAALVASRPGAMPEMREETTKLKNRLEWQY